MEDVAVGQTVLIPGSEAPHVVSDVIHPIDHAGTVTTMAALEGLEGWYWPASLLRRPPSVNPVFELTGSPWSVAAIEAALVTAYPHWPSGGRCQRCGDGGGGMCRMHPRLVGYLAGADPVGAE